MYGTRRKPPLVFRYISPLHQACQSSRVHKKQIVLDEKTTRARIARPGLGAIWLSSDFRVCPASKCPFVRSMAEDRSLRDDEHFFPNRRRTPSWLSDRGPAVGCDTFRCRLEHLGAKSSHSIADAFARLDPSNLYASKDYYSKRRHRAEDSLFGARSDHECLASFGARLTARVF